MGLEPMTLSLAETCSSPTELSPKTIIDLLIIRFLDLNAKDLNSFLNY